MSNKQLIPVTGVDQVGIIRDTPAHALPPNAWSDGRNVYFKDGTVFKRQGTVRAFTDIDENRPTLDAVETSHNYEIVSVIQGQEDWQAFGGPLEAEVGAEFTATADTDISAFGTVQRTALEIAHIAYWPNPDERVYIEIVRDIEDNTDPMYRLRALTEDDTAVDVQLAVAGAAIPITPIDGIQDSDWNTSLFTGGHNIIINNNRYAPGYIFREGNQDNVASDRFKLDILPGWETTTPGDNQITTARVVRGVGNRMIAGNFTFRSNSSDPDLQVVQGSYPGTIRVSALAPAGAVPTTWDPFDIDNPGADEFELSNTSPVVEIVPLQGQAIVYTTNSIHSITFQGLDAIVRNVADGYGALTTGSVLEFDGKHFVVGSNDLYIFGGHPGSIQSVADAKVREFFFSNINPLANVQENIFLLRDSERDEIQIYYPSVLSTAECDRFLAWNYRNNTWSINETNNVISGVIGPLRGGGIANTEIRVDAGLSNNPVANPSGQDVATQERQTITVDSSITLEAPRPETQSVTFSGTSATVFDEEEFTLTVNPDVYPGNPEMADFTFSNDFNSGTQLVVLDETYDGSGMTADATDVEGVGISVTTSDAFEPQITATASGTAAEGVVTNEQVLGPGGEVGGTVTITSDYEAEDSVTEMGTTTVSNLEIRTDSNELAGTLNIEDNFVAAVTGTASGSTIGTFSLSNSAGSVEVTSDYAPAVVGEADGSGSTGNFSLTNGAGTVVIGTADRTGLTGTRVGAGTITASSGVTLGTIVVDDDTKTSTADTDITIQEAANNLPTLPSNPAANTTYRDSSGIPATVVRTGSDSTIARTVVINQMTGAGVPVGTSVSSSSLTRQTSGTITNLSDVTPWSGTVNGETLQTSISVPAGAALGIYQFDNAGLYVVDVVVGGIIAATIYRVETAGATNDSGSLVLGSVNNLNPPDAGESITGVDDWTVVTDVADTGGATTYSITNGGGTGVAGAGWSNNAATINASTGTVSIPAQSKVEYDYSFTRASGITGGTLSVSNGSDDNPSATANVTVSNATQTDGNRTYTFNPAAAFTDNRVLTVDGTARTSPYTSVGTTVLSWSATATDPESGSTTYTLTPAAGFTTASITADGMTVSASPYTITANAAVGAWSATATDPASGMTTYTLVPQPDFTTASLQVTGLGSDTTTTAETLSLNEASSVRSWTVTLTDPVSGGTTYTLTRASQYTDGSGWTIGGVVQANDTVTINNLPVQNWSVEAIRPAMGGTTYTVSDIPAAAAFTFTINPGEADEVVLTSPIDNQLDLAHTFSDGDDNRPWAFAGTVGGTTTATISGTGITSFSHLFDPGLEEEAAAEALRDTINANGQLVATASAGVVSVAYRTMNPSTSLAIATDDGPLATGTLTAGNAVVAGTTLTQYNIRLFEGTTELGNTLVTVSAFSDGPIDIRDDLLDALLILGNSNVPSGEPAWVLNTDDPNIPVIETNSHRNLSLIIENANAIGLDTGVGINEEFPEGDHAGHIPDSISITDPNGTSTVAFTLFSGEALADVLTRIETEIDTITETPNWTSEIDGNRLVFTADAIGRFFNGPTQLLWDVTLTQGDGSLAGTLLAGDTVLDRISELYPAAVDFFSPIEGDTHRINIGATSLDANAIAADIATGISSVAGLTATSSDNEVRIVYTDANFPVSAERALTLPSSPVRDVAAQFKTPITIPFFTDPVDPQTVLTGDTINPNNAVNFAIDALSYGVAAHDQLPETANVVRGHPALQQSMLAVTLATQVTATGETVRSETRNITFDYDDSEANMVGDIGNELLNRFNEYVTIVDQDANSIRVRSNSFDAETILLLDLILDNQTLQNTAETYVRSDAPVMTPEGFTGLNDPERPWLTDTFNLARDVVILANQTSITGSGFGYTWNADPVIDPPLAGIPYESYVERIHNPLDNEVEYTKSAEHVQLLLSDGDVDVTLGMTDSPGNTLDVFQTENGDDGARTFFYQDDYKVDFRRHGRLFNIRIGDPTFVYDAETGETREKVLIQEGATVDIQVTGRTINNPDGTIADPEVGWRVAGYGVSAGREEQRGGRR